MRTTLLSARSPRVRPRASSMIDLPAPVSPLITLMPRFSSRSVFDDGVVVNRQMNQHGKAPDFAWLAIYTVVFLLSTSAEG